MAASKPARITITKIEGARRQIEAAVALWFQDGDPAVIHTLVAAGHQVCHNIITKRKGESPIFFNKRMFPDGDLAEHKKTVLKLENFLKHANHDPDPYAKITYSTEWTSFYALDAIILWHMIEGKRHPLFEAFCAWFFISRPRFFKHPVNLFPHLGVVDSDLSRSEFLAKYLKENG